MLPDKSGIDCTTHLEGSAPVVPTKLRYWRVNPSREVLFDTTVAISEPGRAFVGPVPRFYDDHNRGYFVAATEEWSAPPDCTLLTVESGALSAVASAPDLGRSECYESAAWSQRTGLSLREP